MDRSEYESQYSVSYFIVSFVDDPLLDRTETALMVCTAQTLGLFSLSASISPVLLDEHSSP